MSSAAGLAALRQDWEALFGVTPEASGFQSHAWIAASWSRVDDGEDELHVAVVSQGADVVAIFPARLSPHGRLRFIGAELGNYAGPVADPTHLEEAVAIWGEHLRRDRRISAVDLRGLRGRSPFLGLVRRRGLPGWGRPVAVGTNTCPEVELNGGWDSLVERHKSKQRSTWRRKAARLERLGQVEFAESGEVELIEQAMPRVVELWSRRWAGRRVHPSFAAEADFQLDAARRLAAGDLALLSTLRVDGEIIAFAYGVRGRDFTSSYALAHDQRFDRYSPGLLLLLRVLEAACDRGDQLYDFSLGEAPYKSMWVTREQEVFRALWGRGRHVSAAWSSTWARARSVDRLRALKVGGWRAAVGRAPAAREPSEQPGLPAGQSGRPLVYELPSASSTSASLRRCSYRQMRELLSPGLVEVALERSFRGDDLLLVDDEAGPAGVVWQAAKSRRAAVAGRELSGDVAVYYDPVALAPRDTEELLVALGSAASGLIVTGGPPAGR